MDENTENTEGVRVTRARTRRLSALDTDSRPGTPLLDTASERGTASPRPTRRTRLNSATELSRTPTRTTRASVVRGETPEPTTPASVKRAARTPAKSTRAVRQQQALKEETVEELEPDDNDKPSNNPSPAPALGSPAGERRVTRSMSQTPPAAYRSANNTPLPVSETQQQQPLKPDASISVEEQQAVPIANKNKQSSGGRMRLTVRVENLSASTATEALKKSLASVVPNSPSMELQVKEVTEETSSSSSPQDIEAQVESLASEMAKAEEKQAAEKSETQTDSLAMEMAKSEANANMEAEAQTKTPTKSPERRESEDLLEKVYEDIDTIEIASELLKSGEAQKDKELDAEVDLEQKIIENAASKSIIEAEVFESPASPDPEPQPLDSSPLAPKQLIMEDEPREEIQSPDAQPMEKNNNSAFKEMAMEVDAEEEIPFEDAEPIEGSTTDVIDAAAERQEEGPLGSHRLSHGMNIIDNVQLPALTPGVKARLVTSDSVDSKKSVCFDSDSADAEADKVKFPKTPARSKSRPAIALDISQMMAKADTPTLKPDTDTPLRAATLKARNSSTPIPKDDREASMSMLKPAPARIDCLKPWDQVEAERKEEALKAENKDKDKSQPKRSNKISNVLRMNSDDEEYEDFEFLSEYVDNEVEVAPDDYVSGDSMASSERREIEENEIIDEGESVGSQDTDESIDEQSEGNDSFVVSDTSEVGELRYSSNELEDEQDEHSEEKSPNVKKQRARIIIMESSEDEQPDDKPEEKEKEEKEKPEQEHAEVEEKQLAMPKNQSDCSSNASKLSEAAQILIGSQEHYSTSETELENSRKLFLNEINKSECLNKTAPRLDMTAMEVDSTDDDAADNGETPKADKGNQSVYEVLDSEEDDEEGAEEEQVASESSSKNKSSSFVRQQKQKVNDEEAVLAELASSDLTHLETMFNPLQKSRRQSLYMPSPEMAAKEPKLQRRSERGMVNDFCPSQSFVEMLAERKSHQSKRKRLSKSFSGAAEELEVIEVRQDHKRPKNTHNESSASMEEELHVEEIARSEGQPKEPENNEELAAATEDIPPKEEPEMVQSKNEAEKAKAQPLGKWSKNAQQYMEFCDLILQRANEAKLEQKKQQIATGKKQKKPKRIVSEAVLTSVVAPQTTTATVSSSTGNVSKPVQPKKEVKRLQAARHAVSHAVNLLVPQPAASKEPRSLVRKLSPQPPLEAKMKTKTKAIIKNKQKSQLVSPVKSSDEENHQKSPVVNRIKTNAGYVTVAMDDAREPRIELIKTRSGIMRVEPATPTQKYFREEPNSPPPNRNFRELRVPARGAQKKSKQQKQQPKGGGHGTTENPAMLSALRFKEQIFGRK
ncbi:protein slender lobes [Drosophila guanche]|uniref:Blast:Protein slender lobes n=1 Tax=Drosophila guanche TaxID=7266 RepID=A0A3B0K2Z8_DROGU|nr:protein slender lobes [Drosophila guanche]SPP87693.1 blast:Protein slender lobes [Drosophila guanche]